MAQDSQVSPTRASSPHGTSACTAADDAPTRRARLAGSGNTLLSSSSVDEEPAQPDSSLLAKGFSAADTLSVGSAASPYDLPQTGSTSPREPQTLSPYPGFGLPAPDIAPPPPPIEEGHPASLARGPSDAGFDVDGSQLRAANAAASTHPGDRFGRIGVRRADSPTLGSDVYAAVRGNQSPAQQVSPARVGTRLPASPSSRRIPASPAPQLPRHSARTGPPATTQAP